LSHGLPFPISEKYSCQEKHRWKSKKIIVFLILFLSLSNLFGIGLRDWVTITENDTKFRDAGGGTIITLTNRKKYEHPYRWYFYKDNIIGTGKEYLEGGYEYEFFIIDEGEGDIYLFEEEEKWKEFIKTNELRPKYWTRWFRLKRE
jgi:hypothetical protein